ncbi:MAG: hypothetical protein ACSLEN_12905 [Candidatus Malihini olakiniferum]
MNLASVNYYFGFKDGLLHAVLDAVLGPLVKTAKTPYGERIVVRLLQHLHATPEYSVTSLLSAQLEHVAHRFIDALSRTLPHLARADVIWR